jgi:hypothetical protein
MPTHVPQFCRKIISRLTFGASVSHVREWLWKEMTAGFVVSFYKDTLKMRVLLQCI